MQHNDTKRIGLLIVYLNGSQVECSKLWVYLSLKAVSILANSADTVPNEGFLVYKGLNKVFW